jgi:hypothetical protein
METRSNHVLVGAVVLILLAAAAIFTVWLARVSDGDQKVYDIFFKQSVEGLARPARCKTSRSGRTIPISFASGSKSTKMCRC